MIIRAAGRYGLLSLPLQSFALCAALITLTSCMNAQSSTHSDNITYFANSYPALSADPSNPNSNPGYKSGLWIPNASDGLFEMPGGTVFVNGIYDEEWRDAAIFHSSGTNVGLAGDVENQGTSILSSPPYNLPYDNGPLYANFADTHGIGRSAGSAVTADPSNASSNVYLAVQQKGNFAYQQTAGNWFNPAGFPPTNCEVFQTMRVYTQSGNPVINTSNLGGANGYDGSMMILPGQTKAVYPSGWTQRSSTATYTAGNTVLYKGNFWQAETNITAGTIPGSSVHGETPPWSEFSCNSYQVHPSPAARWVSFVIGLVVVFAR